MSDLMWDAFLLYAPEDKQIGTDYAIRLFNVGFTIWFDDQTRVESAGQLEEAIGEGLMRSRCGIVILSSSLLQRCPISECNALFTLQGVQRKTIFPVWHKISTAELGGWTVFSKAGSFTTDGPDEVIRNLTLGIRSLPGSLNSQLRFFDSLYSDPVSVKTFVTACLEEGKAAQVLWPPEFSLLKENVERLKLEAEQCHNETSPFHRVPRDHVINFIDSAASALRNAREIERNVTSRILALIQGMAEYWNGSTFLIERSLVNFLTLANFDAQRQLAYCFRYQAVSDQMPPSWLPWFEPERTSLRLYADLFGIGEEMCNARVHSISDAYLNLYVWGPRSMVMEAVHTSSERPIVNPWFVKYLIPQVELACIWNPGLQPFKYRETALITKVVDENGNELY